MTTQINDRFTLTFKTLTEKSSSIILKLKILVSVSYQDVIVVHLNYNKYIASIKFNKPN